MKKTIAILSTLVLVMGLSAHPAADVTVNLDYAGKTAEVIYKHTGGSATHFIDEVIVKLNGKRIITQTISMQATEKGGTVKYLIPELKKGDVVEADTHCSKGGNKSGKAGGEAKKQTIPVSPK